MTPPRSQTCSAASRARSCSPGTPTAARSSPTPPAATADVKALVYVAGLAPDKGENVPDLTGKFPGATLGEHLYEVPLADGTADVYVHQNAYHQHFSADLSAEQAALDAATQRPFSTAALTEGSGEPAWKTIPSWFIYPELDLAIPAQAFRFMAERAGARATVEIPGRLARAPGLPAAGGRRLHPPGRGRRLSAFRNPPICPRREAAWSPPDPAERGQVRADATAVVPTDEIA